MGAISEINNIVKSHSWRCKSAEFGIFEKRVAYSPANKVKHDIRTPAKNTNANAPAQGKENFPKFNRSDYRSVYDFWGQIAPEILKRQVGSDASSKYRKAFSWVSSVPVEYGKLPDGVNGRYDYGRKKVILRPGAPASHFAHELRHAFSSFAPYTEEGTRTLDWLWRFSDKDISPGKKGYHRLNWKHDLFATHLQHQFDVYEELRRKLGKAPTPEQFFNYNSNMPRWKRVDERGRLVNGYQQQSDKSHGKNSWVNTADMLPWALNNLFTMRNGVRTGAPIASRVLA